MNKTSEKNNPHIEKRTLIVENINSKIEFIKTLYSFALSLDNHEFEDLTAEKFELMLWEMFNDHINTNKSLKDALTKIHHLRELNVLLVVKKTRYDQLWTPEKNEARNSHREAILKYKAEIEEIEKDESVLYLKQIVDYIAYLKMLRKDRNRLKELYTQDGNVFKKDGLLMEEVNEFLYNFFKNIPKGPKQGNLGNANYSIHIEDIQFNGLGVIIIFKERTKEKLVHFRDLLGQNFRDNSFLWCFENDEDDLTQRHEYNHALFGAHIGHKTVYENNFIHKLNQLLIELDLNLSNLTFVEKEKQIREYVLNYPNNLMGEMFADLTNIFDYNLARGFANHFTNTISKLNHYINKTPNENIKNVIKKAKEDLILKMNKVKLELAKLVYCTNALNVKNEMISAFLLYNGDIRKCFRYLNEKFGEDKVENALKNFDQHDHQIHKSLVEKKLVKFLNKTGLEKK